MKKKAKAAQTSFSDVCGTMDELKRLLDEKKQDSVCGRAGAARPLIRDALFMLEKMETRIGEYMEFASGIEKISRALLSVEHTGIEDGLLALKKLSKKTSSKERKPEGFRAEIFELAESVREAATRQESCMRDFKGLALEVNRLFTNVRGARPWILSDVPAGGCADELLKKYQAYLPPEPHGSKLLERMVKGKNVAIEMKEGREPYVSFEDGGIMRMSRVRWNENIKNFHQAGTAPGKSGRSYRRKDPAKKKPLR